MRAFTRAVVVGAAGAVLLLSGLCTGAQAADVGDLIGLPVGGSAAACVDAVASGRLDLALQVCTAEDLAIVCDALEGALGSVPGLCPAGDRR
ncbi:hypothetical protein [Streptomyces sp. NPDC055056]